MVVALSAGGIRGTRRVSHREESLKHVKFFAVGLAVLVLLALVACGGDDDESGNDGDGQEPTASAPADGDGNSGDDGEAPTEAPDDDEPTGTPGDNDDDENDGSGGQGDHTCNLLTPEEVSSAVGVEVGEGRDYLATAPGATNCEWQSTEESVTVYAEVLTEGGRDYFDAVHLPDPAFEEEPVEGIGDEAIYSDLGVLDVVDGDTFVSVQMVVFFSELDELTAAQALAETILQKLQ